MQLLLFLSELHLGFSVKFDNAFHDFTIKWDVLRDLVPFAQFQKNVEWVFFTLLIYTNGTKSGRASQIQRACSDTF